MATFSSAWGSAAWGSVEWGGIGGVAPPPGPPAGTPGGEGQRVSGGPPITGAPWRLRVVSPPPSPPAPPVKGPQQFAPAVEGGPLRSGPFAHFHPTEPLPNQAPPAVPPPINPRLPEVSGGPLAFAPWNQRRVIRDPLPNINPPPPIPQMMPPAVTGGPVRGAPWHRLEVNTPAAAIVPPPPPSRVGSDAGQMVVGGPISFAPWSHGGPVPVQPVPGPTPPQPPQPTLVGETPPVPQVPTDDKRLFRFSQIVATMLNALVRRGEIVRAGPDDWALADIVLSFNGRTGAVTLELSDLPLSPVVPGTYTVPDFDVDEGGRIISAVSRTASIGVPLVGTGADQSPAFSSQQVNVDSRVGAIIDNGPSGSGTVTLNITTADRQLMTLTGNPTLAVTGQTNIPVFTLILLQDGAGGRSVNWFSGIRWAGGVTPTLTSTPNKYDVFTFMNLGGGVYLGFTAGQNI